MEVMIESMDHFGLGVAHINEKVVFVENALPGEIVKIKIIEDKKKLAKAKVLEYIKKSDKRIKPICPYFEECGGCSLMFLEYLETLDFKKKKVQELILKNKIFLNFDNKNIEVVQNENYLNYRNKVSLKIIDGKIGYFKSNTHELVEISECKIANKEINEVIGNYKLLGVKNGNLIIRVNSNNEILLVIETNEENYNIEFDKLKEKIKLVGIVYNNKTIYGESYLYERIGGFLFKVSYNSFFQINPYICAILFKLINNEIADDDIVLDLYSGVGTLGIVASKKAKEVISVEIIKNAVLNGIFNAKINKQDNIHFILGDTGKVVNKITQDFNTLIVDPPRNGLDKNTISFIKENLPEKIIYVSCDANTLIRDLKDLESNYNIVKYKILDMFSYSYHLESFVVLYKK